MKTVLRAAEDDVPISIPKHRTSQTDAFMQEFRQRAYPIPFGRNMYALNIAEEPGDMDVMFETYPWEGRIHLAAIFSLGKRHAGVATQALNWMLDLADKHNVEIDGVVKPIPNTRPKDGGRALNAAELKRWYTKLGFKVKRGGDMIYTPGSRAK